MTGGQERIPNERKLQHKVTERKRLEEMLVGGVGETEKSKERIGPFNPQELKALGELAKRLARGRGK